MQCIQQIAFIAAAGFEGNPASAQIHQPADQLDQPLSGVGKHAVLLGGQDMDDQFVLGDIDADVRVHAHSVVA